MTSPNDFVYNSIYKGCKAEKCDELTSKDAAVMGLQAFKNGQYSTPIKLINDSITNAKKLRIKKKAK